MKVPLILQWGTISPLAATKTVVLQQGPLLEFGQTTISLA